MTLKIAVQMDAIDSIKFDKDTTIILMLEAQKRGHELYYYQPHNLYLENGRVIARSNKITVRLQKDDYFTLGEQLVIDLSDMDVVLMRQDPPFDMNYLTYSYMLDKIHPKTLVVSNPAEVRNCPEKLFVCDFAKFTPPTLITSDKARVREFMKEQGEIVLKPLYAFGGQDVAKVTEENLDEIADKLWEKYKVPFIAQKFIAGITKGDKRIMLIDGEFVGALNRIPGEGTILSNLAQGGTAEKTELTPREIEICEALKPELKKRGLLIAGIDVIVGYLTEINVTSPTGFQAINRLNGSHIEEIFWDVVERKRNK